MTTLVQAIEGLTSAVQSIVVELRLQRVAIAKLGAQRELDKEENLDSLDSLGQRVVAQEGRVTRLELVPPFPRDEPPTRPEGPRPPRPPIPRYPRRP